MPRTKEELDEIWDALPLDQKRISLIVYNSNEDGYRKSNENGASYEIVLQQLVAEELAIESNGTYWLSDEFSMYIQGLLQSGRPDDDDTS